MDLDQYYEQIEAYINNTLSKEERTTFEQQLNEHPSLKKAVLNHVLANEAIGLSIEDKIAGKLDRLAQSRAAVKSPPSLKVGWKKRLAIAAGILFLVLAGLAIWVNQNYTNQALSNQLYANSTLPTVRNEGDADKKLTNALVAFSNKNYKAVLKELATKSPEDNYFNEAQYLMAHANWKEKNYQQAATLFESLLSSSYIPPSIDRQELEWNHLLTTLQLQGAESESFKKEINAILENSQHGYFTKATELNRQLNSVWRKLTF